MKGIEFKLNTIVIMDSSNKGNVTYITDMLRAWNAYGGNPRVYPLSKNHSSILVVKMQLEERDINHVNDLIERRFPGLCIFNPPMAV